MFEKKNLNIPRPIHHEIREQQFPDLSGMDLNIPSYKPVVNEAPNMNNYPKGFQKTEVREFHRNEQNAFENSLAKPSTRNIVKDNTLFVKIDKYQESMKTLNLIKESLMSTEHILSKLHQIKAQEDNEIQQWHEQIKRIKQKIVFIDRNLFEQ